MDGFLGDLGWQVGPQAPGRQVLAAALAALRRTGRADHVSALEPYARLADELARHEVATLAPAATRAETVEAVVVGTVVFETALLALRRLAQEHHSATRFAPCEGVPAEHGPAVTT